MKLYKNLSNVTRTFWGVSIKPGEVKGIPGNVNADYMLQVAGLVDADSNVSEKPSAKRGRRKSKAEEVVESPAEPIVEESVDNLDLDKDTNDEAE